MQRGGRSAGLCGGDSGRDGWAERRSKSEKRDLRGGLAAELGQRFGRVKRSGWDGEEEKRMGGSGMMGERGTKWRGRRDYA